MDGATFGRSEGADEASDPGFPQPNPGRGTVLFALPANRKTGTVMVQAERGNFPIHPLIVGRGNGNAGDVETGTLQDRLGLASSGPGRSRFPHVSPSRFRPVGRLNNGLDSDPHVETGTLRSAPAALSPDGRRQPCSRFRAPLRHLWPPSPSSLAKWQSVPVSRTRPVPDCSYRTKRTTRPSAWVCSPWTSRHGGSFGG